MVCLIDCRAASRVHYSSLRNPERAPSRITLRHPQHNSSRPPSPGTLPQGRKTCFVVRYYHLYPHLLFRSCSTGLRPIQHTSLCSCMSREYRHGTTRPTLIETSSRPEVRAAVDPITCKILPGSSYVVRARLGDTTLTPTNLP